MSKQRLQELAGIKVEKLNVNSPQSQKIIRVWNWVEDMVEGEEIEHELKTWLENYIKENNLNQDIDKNSFKEIWAKSLSYYGCGDYGADWEYFEPTWKWVETGDDSSFDEY